MRGPIAKSYNEGLSDSHGHTPSTDSAPPKTQCNADEDHHDRDQGQRHTVVVIRQQTGKGKPFLPKAFKVAVNFPEGHRF